MAVVVRLRPVAAKPALALLDALEFDVDGDRETYELACDLACRLRQHLFDTLYHAVAIRLENLIERALLLCPPGEPLTVDDLFDRTAEPLAAAAGNGSLHAEVVRFERERIREALAGCGGNKTQAARQLGLTYRGLLMKMQRYGMTGGEPGRAA